MKSRTKVYKKREFELDNSYIELIRLLKLLKIAESGGQAKTLVENSEVRVNGVQEHRKRAKLRKGDIIEVFDFQIIIQ